MTEFDVAAWAISTRVMDGGGLRVSAFRDALAKHVRVRLFGLGPAEPESLARRSALSRAKRAIAPMPIRLRSTLELRAFETKGNNRVSLVPTAHRWALEAPNISWLDYADLWSAFATRQGESASVLNRTTASVQARLWARREQSESRRAHILTTASWHDSSILTGAVWLPTPVTSNAGHGMIRTDKIEQVGFLANFNYAPNLDAYSWFAKAWLPGFRTTGIPVVVGGFGSDDLPKEAGVSYVGSVRSPSEFYASVGAVVTPIRLGGGMKVKVVEALSYGLPVLASEHALDGLPPALQQACTSWSPSISLTSWLDRAADPRESSQVRDSLRKFTVEDFEQTVAYLLAQANAT